MDNSFYNQCIVFGICEMRRLNKMSNLSRRFGKVVFNLKLSNLIVSDVASHMLLILGIFLFKLLFISILFSFFLSFLKPEIVSFVLTVNVSAFFFTASRVARESRSTG